MATNGLAALELEQARFFTQVGDGFATASARTGEVVRDIRVAGTSVRLRFAGEALIPSIVPGLAYSGEVSPNEASCEICLWDSESTGVPLAPPPRGWEDFTERGNIWGFDSKRYRSAYLWGEGSVNVMDREIRQAVYWVPSYKQLPAWTLASPLRTLLHWWMELNGRQLVHAAAVGHGGRGVLIPGRGGSGKSSTSLACLQGGMEFIADDYLAVALDPEPRAYRLYSTAKLDPRSLRLYPELEARCRAVYQPGFDKVVLFLEDGYRDQLRESLPLHLVLKPRISGEPDTTLGPVEPREIERALASETLVHLPHAGAQTVEFLERVSHDVPSATINLGTDRPRIVTAIRSALEANCTPPKAPPVRESRPFVSIIVHFDDENREELRKLAAGIEAQDYPRTELIVTASNTGRAMADEVARLPGSVRFLRFDDPVMHAQAWNRSIRESFAELLIFVEPGDQFPPGAFAALVDESEREPEAAWALGTVKSSRPDEKSANPLHGALIRKRAFRECGLFQTQPVFQGREQRDWLKRATEMGLTGREFETITLHAAPAASQSLRLPDDVNWGALRSHLDRLRQKTPR